MHRSALPPKTPGASLRLLCVLITISYVQCQSVVAMSTCEAEAIAAADLIKEITFVVSLLESANLPVYSTPTAYVDNQAVVLEVSNNPVHHGIVHFIQDAVKRQIITPTWIRTNAMLRKSERRHFHFPCSRLSVTSAGGVLTYASHCHNFDFQ